MNVMHFTFARLHDFYINGAFALFSLRDYSDITVRGGSYIVAVILVPHNIVNFLFMC